MLNPKYQKGYIVETEHMRNKLIDLNVMANDSLLSNSKPNTLRLIDEIKEKYNL